MSILFESTPPTKAALLHRYQQRLQRYIRLHAGSLQEVLEYDAELRRSMEEYWHKVQQDFTRFYFVTVNPKPDTALSDFLKVLQKFTDRKMCQRVLYALEQRSEDSATMGAGMHAHLVVVSPEKNFVTNTINTFKNVVGNRAAIDVKSLPRQYLEDKVNYIKGNKDSDSKMRKVCVDQVWRAHHSLQHLYAKNFSVEGNTPDGVTHTLNSASSVQEEEDGGTPTRSHS